MSEDGGLLEENVKLLMLRERELLSLRRKQQRFEAWLSLTQSLAGIVGSDRNRALLQVSEAFKSKLAFQEVLFFNAAGRSLSAIALDPDVDCVGAPLNEHAVVAVFGAKSGQSEAFEGPPANGPARFHRYLWHWLDTLAPPLLLVAGYDRERAQFYPPFEEADLAQFAIAGRELDLLLGTVVSTRQRAPAEQPVETCQRPFEVLTGREVEVSRLLARGKTNKEIGALLGISSRTVQSHVANIFDKLGVRNRAGAVSWLVEHRVAV